MHFALVEKSFIHLFVSRMEDSEALLSVLDVVALVHYPITVVHDPHTLHLIRQPLPVEITTICELVAAESLQHVLNPITIVKCILAPLIFTLTIFLPIFVNTSIFGSIRPLKLSLAI